MSSTPKHDVSTSEHINDSAQSSPHLAESPSSDHDDAQNPPPRITTISKQPMISPAQAHLKAATPLIVDISALSDTHTHKHASARNPTHRPVFRRLGLHRPPPSTPPEPVSHDQLSMPTLPSLHATSVPVLIEQYREERRLNPTGFDARTIAIKQALVQAKVDRGGVAHLLENEYTAELASRLDASVIEEWSVVRKHDVVEEVGSDDEELDGRVGEEYAVDDGPNVKETGTADGTGAGIINAHEMMKKAGQVETNSKVTEFVDENGVLKRVYETRVKITHVVDVAVAATAGQEVAGSVEHKTPGEGLGVVGNISGDATEEDTIDGIVNSLARLRSDMCDSLSDDLWDALNETKLRLKALRESK